jgi:hypothetical protein
MDMFSMTQGFGVPLGLFHWSASYSVYVMLNQDSNQLQASVASHKLIDGEQNT